VPVVTAWAHHFAIKSGPYTRVAPPWPSKRRAHTSGCPSGTASVVSSTALIVAASSRADITRFTAAAVNQPRARAFTIASIQPITSS
jgi:hypothetical protein